MSSHQVTLQVLDPDRHTGEDTRSQLARAEVGAAAGVEQHFTFPATTGTDYVPPGRRGTPADERPDEDEPPHLERGTPHDDEPAPYDDA